MKKFLFMLAMAVLLVTSLAGCGTSENPAYTMEYTEGKVITGESMNVDTFSLEMFENIAYVMAKHADANIPDTPEEWLDGFNTFFIYQVLPQLIELWGLNVQTDVSAKKKVRPTDRPMTTPLFLLRCVQLGISIRDLDLLTIGLVNDMYAENSNDDYKGYKEVATQEDFDKF
nr:hypothetical protein [Coprococcus sp. AF21-14LB]